VRATLLEDGVEFGSYGFVMCALCSTCKEWSVDKERMNGKEGAG